jgi:DNA-binding NtrC family response regulator
VLIVDDDEASLCQMSETVEGLGFAIRTATSGQGALDCLRGGNVDVLLLDLVMPDIDGLAVLEAMARAGASVPAIVAVARPDPALLASAANAGAMDFVEKPATAERLRFAIEGALRRDRLETALAAERRRRDGQPAFVDFFTKDALSQRALAVATKAARNSLPLLIEGEVGTGRSFLARGVHDTGERCSKPFLTVRNAPRDIEAAWAAAAGGTLLIEEIGRLTEAEQARLFALLEPAGRELSASRPGRRPDTRLIATSRCRLLELTRRGLFREDLYYRLNAMPIYLPPLRERPADIGPLATRLLTRFAAEIGRPAAGLSADALDLLRRYDWPENIGQLESVLCRAVALGRESLLHPADFPDLLVTLDGREAAAAAFVERAPTSAPIHIDQASQRFREAAAPALASDRFLTEKGISRLADVERNLIAFALGQCQGQMARTARALGIGRSTLYRKLREYGLDTGMDTDAA